MAGVLALLGIVVGTAVEFRDTEEDGTELTAEDTAELAEDGAVEFAGATNEEDGEREEDLAELDEESDGVKEDWD